MLFIVALCGFIIYRWTSRVASRMQMCAETTNARFIGLLGLKMLWRIGIIFIALIGVSGAESTPGGAPDQNWLALAFLSVPVNFIVMGVSAFYAARERRIKFAAIDSQSAAEVI